MKQYLELLNHVLINGEEREDRTGTGTISIFGAQFRHDLTKGFPLLTTKKLHWKSIVHELLWMMRGDTNIKYLNDNGVRIWDEWADSNGNLGPVYGRQWRNWSTFHPVFTPDLGHSDAFRTDPIDQLKEAIEQIENNPYSRRIVVSAWNPADVSDMALPPCHMFFQFYCHTNGDLSLHMYQRSADIFLGVPFNIASYALLLTIVADITDRRAKDLIISYGDIHLYKNHISQAVTQLRREPLDLPEVSIKQHHKPTLKQLSIDNITFDQIILHNYEAHEKITAQVSI